MKKIRLALLISGGGTTALSIILACQNGILKDLVEIVCVIASNALAKGLQKALAAGIPSDRLVVIDPSGLTPDAFGLKIIETADRFGATHLGQHGWMAITPPNVIARFLGKMLNQHPGPLDPGFPGFGGVKPGMYGARVTCARLYYVRKTKCDTWTESTAQLVDEQVDEGLLVHTQRVAIEPSDTVESLQERLLPVEHATQIEAWRRMATGEARPAPRSERLIRPEHLPILTEAKLAAKYLYPKG